MTGGTDAGEPLDRMAELIAALAAGLPPAGSPTTAPPADTAVSRELHAAIHDAVYPMCLRLLSIPDIADEAEQETWRRLLEHIRSHDLTANPIRNGKSYVRQIARNVCNDMGRRITDRRREVPVDEHTADVDDSGAVPADADNIVFPLRGDADRLLVEEFGYTSQRIRDDLAGLNKKEQRVLARRQQGLSYAEIAAEVGESVAAVQRRGERAIQHLRGRVQVTVWRQEPLTSWQMPACATMRRLKMQIHAQLLNGIEPDKAKVFQEIGQHLDPHPNRSRTRGDDPACAVCSLDREHTEQVYGVLVSLLPPLLGLPDRRDRDPDGNLRPVLPPRGERPDRAAAISQYIGTMIFVLLLITCCGGIVHWIRTTDFDDPSTSPSATPTATGSRTRTPAVAVVPDACKLVTPAEVSRSLGGATFDACKGDPSPQPGAAPRTTSLANFARPSALQGRPRDVVAIIVSEQTGAPADLMASCKASIQISGPSGTVPGLGDANCYGVDGSNPSVAALVLVSKGRLLLSVRVMIEGVTKDSAVRLAKLIASRLP
jgi:RNA polymerase sigma factor (sigma-70 family)